MEKKQGVPTCVIERTDSRLSAPAIERVDQDQAHGLRSSASTYT